MKTAIIIPARYHSTRLPGKPLVMIKGQTMLQRVVNLSHAAAKDLKNVSVIVATDDERIQQHCNDLNVEVIMTSHKCPTGTDRVAEAVKQLKTKPDFILNMQGDAPFTPPEFLKILIEKFWTASGTASACDVITPVTQLTWEELDLLRFHKVSTPMSGTTAVFNEKTGNAHWFSKNIIPAIRNEAHLREKNNKSPVYRHIGLYGYSHDMLKKFITLPESHFEKLEGLEQLRILENGFTIRCIPVDYHGHPTMSGIDSPEDVVRAEKLLIEHGEPHHD